MVAKSKFTLRHPQCSLAPKECMLPDRQLRHNPYLVCGIIALRLAPYCGTLTCTKRLSIKFVLIPHWSRFDILISSPGLLTLILGSLPGVPGLLVDVPSRKLLCNGDLAGVAVASRSKYPLSSFSYCVTLIGGGRNALSSVFKPKK